MRKSIIACFLFIFQLCNAQTVKIDSMKMVLKSMQLDTQKVKLMNTITTELWQIAKYDEAMVYANSVLKMCEVGLGNTSKNSRNFYLNQKAGVLRSVGIIYGEQGNYGMTLINFGASLEIYQELGDKKGVANTYGNIGHVYSDQGNYPEALTNYLFSLSHNETLKDTNGMAIDYQNLGVVYRLQGNYSEALKYINLSMVMYKASGNRQGVGNCYNSIGLVNRMQGKYDEALSNYSVALGIRKDGGNKRGEGYTLTGMGSTYILKKEYESANDNFVNALEIFIAISDKRGIAGTYIDLANVNFNIQNFAESNKYYNQALPIALEVKSKDEITEIYAGLSALDSAKGNFQLSLEHYKLYIVYRDSMYNETNTKKLVQSQMNYEFQKKQAADSITNTEHLKHEQLKHDQEIQQQRLYTFGGGIGFALMLIVAGVSFRDYRNKQKANDIISHQKALVEEKQKEILDSIHYAKRIQQSLLPTTKYIDNNINRLKN